MAIEQVEPAVCSLWQFHQRSGEETSGEACNELIASIKRHGQRHPVLGRRLEQGAEAPIELIYGGRRLLAATRLGIKLLVDVRDLDDRSGIVEMEIENRLRTDISPYERGMSYRRWLNAQIFTSQSELARELEVSEAQVSKLLRYADLPAAVVGAFDSVGSIREEWAVALAKLCQEPRRRAALARRARELACAERHHSPKVIFHQLMSEVSLRGCPLVLKRDEVVKSAAGKPIYKIAVRATAVHFILPRATLSEEVVQQLRQQLTRILEQEAHEKVHLHATLGQRVSHRHVPEVRNAGGLSMDRSVSRSTSDHEARRPSSRG